MGQRRARAPSRRASRSSPTRSTSLMPGQRLREMHAVGGAVAEGAPDTTQFRTAGARPADGRHDRCALRHAASLRRDSTSKPKIRLLVSQRARHVAPAPSAARYHLANSGNRVRGGYARSTSASTRGAVKTREGPRRFARDRALSGAGATRQHAPPSGRGCRHRRRAAAGPRPPGDARQLPATRRRRRRTPAIPTAPPAVPPRRP